MDFQVKKAENCFADAENYEYLCEITGAQIYELLQTQAISTRINEKIRRPTFFAELPSGVRIKGLLAKNIIKVGYSPNQVGEQKTHFELWLSEIPGTPE